MSSLGEKFPQEQARCRELLSEYQAIGPAGMFGATLIEATLREADEAAMSGDLIRMMQVYERMRGHE